VAHSWSLVTADLSGAPLDTADGDDIAEVLELTLASRIGAIAWRVHRFEPRGASLVGIAARGRVIVHTWPERAALTIDLHAEVAVSEGALAAAVQALIADWPRCGSTASEADLR
jgi:S-adenosylmethionine/arginine decarboxylase-like enzyme